MALRHWQQTDRVVRHRIVLDLMAVESCGAKTAGAKPKARAAAEATTA